MSLAIGGLCGDERFGALTLRGTPILVEAFLDARLRLPPRVRGQALVDLGSNPLLQHRADARQLLPDGAARTRSRLDLLAEDAHGVVGLLSRQVLLEATRHDHFMN